MHVLLNGAADRFEERHSAHKPFRPSACIFRLGLGRLSAGAQRVPFCVLTRSGGQRLVVPAS